MISAGMFSRAHAVFKEVHVCHPDTGGGEFAMILYFFSIVPIIRRDAAHSLIWCCQEAAEERGNLPSSVSVCFCLLYMCLCVCMEHDGV